MYRTRRGVLRKCTSPRRWRDLLGLPRGMEQFPRSDSRSRMNYATKIRKAYDATSPEQRARGRAWYKDTHNLCSTLARYHGLSIYTTAGILAALSPMCNWSLNVTGLLSIVKTGRLPAMGTYNANRIKAARILDGERPAKVLGCLQFDLDLVVHDDDVALG